VRALRALVRALRALVRALRAPLPALGPAPAWAWRSSFPAHARQVRVREPPQVPADVFQASPAAAS
jgi:hypothetical protein